MLVCACQGQAQDGFGAPDTVWALTTLDGAPFDATATLTFTAENRVAGQAPCNSYFGVQTGRFPAFSAPALAASRRACPALEAETRFLSALGAATRATRSGNTLILSDDSAERLVFTRAD